jgi:sulfide:quinone oxidoreductase
VVDDELRLLPDGAILADRFVALPRLRGAPIDGLPQTINGFVPVDAHCQVHGLEDVFAAGDITSFTVKQGGLATQQADVAAEASQRRPEPMSSPDASVRYCVVFS